MGDDVLPPRGTCLAVSTVALGGMATFKYLAKNSSSQLKNASLSSGERFAQSIRSISASSFGATILGTETLVREGGGGRRPGGGGGDGEEDDDRRSGRVLRRMTGGGPAGKGGDGLEAEEPALRKGTGGAEGLPARKLSDKVLEAPVRDGGGSGAGGFGGGGGLDLICASQLIFLLGWLVIWSRVFLTLLAPASATLAALLRSSSIVGNGNRVCENSKESAQMGVAVTSLTFEGWHDVVVEWNSAFKRLSNYFFGGLWRQLWEYR